MKFLIQPAVKQDPNRALYRLSIYLLHLCKRLGYHNRRSISRSWNLVDCFAFQKACNSEWPWTSLKVIEIARWYGRPHNQFILVVSYHYPAPFTRHYHIYSVRRCHGL